MVHLCQRTRSAGIGLFHSLLEKTYPSTFKSAEIGISPNKFPIPPTTWAMTQVPPKTSKKIKIPSITWIRPNYPHKSKSDQNAPTNVKKINK